MRSGCQDEEEEGGLPEDGSGGTVDGPETHAQASPEVVGRRKEKVKPLSKREASRGEGMRPWLQRAEDTVERGLDQPVHAGWHSGYAPCGQHTQ
jgi:hypothetical protein